MRFVIDFEPYAGDLDVAAVTLARELLAACAAARHDVWLAVPAQARDAVETLRLTFADTLPRDRVRALLLPEDAACALPVRLHALAELAPDAVLWVGRDAPADTPFALVTAAPGTASAATLLGRLEDAAQTRAAMTAAGVPSGARKPRLAYVSPLPPERSGIADYSAELVPELAAWYDIELVVDQPIVDDERVAAFPQRDVLWFRAHAHEYERIVYHFGNSHAHKHMFELLREFPGVVVLHDFFFSGVLNNLERENYLKLGFLKALYASHGYTALLDQRRSGRTPAVWKYPLSRDVLDGAAGIIVHSDFSRTLADTWYGPGLADDWHTVPLLRGKPAALRAGDARTAARARLGIAPDAFLVCSFGMLGPTKLNDELLDAFLISPLATDPRCQLVFVGENDGDVYGANLVAKIDSSGIADRIRILGFSPAATYADYLAAADVAVQLRNTSRGETSASVLDCLLYGVPTVINAHGANVTIADDLVIKLPDEFAVSQLTDALTQLHEDGALRSALGRRAQDYVAREHAPAHAAQLVRDAIERIATHGRRARYEALVRDVAPRARDADLPALAAAIAFNRAAPGPRQLLVDVSAMVLSDLKTGIQRVVRSVLLALIQDPPPGFRIEPVFTTGANRGYQYARNWAMRMIGEPDLVLEDAPVDLHAGDVFLGLDLFANGSTQNEACLLDMRTRGVEVVFCMYDVLPVLRPDVFPFGTEQYFRDYLRTVHAVADGIVCISRAVADELAGWYEAQNMHRRLPLQLGWFHLGADIDASHPSTGLPPDAERVLAALGERPTFLMVGTIEPRKGQAQALAAFELLWQQGVDVNLVVVGKNGWMMDALCAHMGAHPEKDKRLFWLAGISDEMLLKLYAGASALLAASEGEGFGLPLIEAAQHGIPIIARGLPVFREVAREHAYYFEGLEAQDLARAIEDWLALWRAGGAPASTGMPWLTWQQSARQLVDAVVGGKWYRTLPGLQL